MEARDLKKRIIYIAERYDLIGFKTYEIEVLEQLDLTMKIIIDGSVNEWIKYEEFDKHWKIIEIYFQRYNLTLTPQYEQSIITATKFNNVSFVSLFFAGSFIIFGIIIKTIFLK
jgi:hypothetical protein